MSKLKILVRNTIFTISIFTILFLVLYGIGRFVHIFPPVGALVQFVKIYNIEKNYGDKSLEYSSSLDKLADIYYKNDFKKWGTKKRIAALKNFVECNHQNTEEYATSLFKYSTYLKKVKDAKFYPTALLCRDILLKLNSRKQINDDLKRNLVQNLLSTYEYDNDLNEKIRLVKVAMEVNNSIKIETEEEITNRIYLLTSLGNYYTDDYKLWIESQNNFEEALQLSNDDKFKFENTFVRISYAHLLIKMRNYSEAKIQLESCDKKIIMSDFQLVYKKLFVEALLGLGYKKETLEQLKNLETLNYNKDPNIQFNTFSQKVQNSILQGNILYSYYYLFRIERLLKKVTIPNNQAVDVYYYLKYLYCLRFNFSEADAWKEKINPINISIGFLFHEVVIERLLNSKNYFEKASTLFLKIQENVIEHFRYLTEHQRMNYWLQYNDAALLLYEAAYVSKEGPELANVCYDAVLFSKGIVLGSSIEFSKLLTESGDTSLLLNYYQLLAIKSDLNAKFAQKQVSDSLNQLAEKIEGRLVQKSHEFGDYTDKMRIKWVDVQSNMLANDIAIEFIDFPTGQDSTIYAALILRKDWTQPKMITLFEEKQLSSIFSDIPSKNYSEDLGLKISDLVWGKLLPFFNTHDNIYFSPTNFLYKLAIESLPMKDSLRINEKFNLFRVSSTKQLCFHREKKAIISTVLYGGLQYSLKDSTLIQESRKYKQGIRGERFISGTKKAWEELSETKVEVDTINRLLQNNHVATVLYSGPRGNEESFKHLSGCDFNIIHIATHGFFYALENNQNIKDFKKYDFQVKMENSLTRSGLILAGANTAWCGEPLPEDVEDGVLTAQDVASLNLRKTDIVILSACVTGLGEITSDGVFGLQRAFKKAGVQTLVMSLWYVNDEATSIFMTSFYKELLNGNDKRMAFVKAQQTVRNIDKYNSPEYWAAFIMLD